MTSDEACNHVLYHDSYNRNCTPCAIERQEANGKRDALGVLHSDNGVGWCVGHVDKWGLCGLRVRFCPVLTSPEKLRQNLREDHELKVVSAQTQVSRAEQILCMRETELQAILMEEY